MRGRVLHSTGFVSSYLKTSYPTAENSLFERCLDHLLKHILPTLLIVFCSSVIALYLGGLIEQAKQAHQPATSEVPIVMLQGAAAQIP